MSKRNILINKNIERLATEYGQRFNYDEENMVDPIEAVFDTRYHKKLVNLQERFSGLVPGMGVLIMDRDVINAYLLCDREDNATFNNSIKQFCYNTDFDFGDVEDLEGVNVAITERDIEGIEKHIKDSSCSMVHIPIEVNSKSLISKLNLSMVIPDNPNFKNDPFINYKFFRKYMKKHNITREDLLDFSNYHEIRHSLDKKYAFNNPIIKQTYGAELDNNYRNYFGECLADAFAVMLVAKDSGNKDFARFIANMRSSHTFENINVLFEINGSIDIRRIKTLRNKKLYMNKEYGLIDNIREQEKDALKSEGLSDVFYHLHHYTSKTTDAISDVIEKKIQDGSLFKMSDKDILELSTKIVKENVYSKEEFARLGKNISKNKKQGVVKDIFNRQVEAFKLEGAEELEEELAENIDIRSNREIRALMESFRVDMSVDASKDEEENIEETEVEQVTELAKNETKEKDYFYELCDRLASEVSNDEELLAFIASELDEIRKFEDKFDTSKVFILRDVVLQDIEGFKQFVANKSIVRYEVLESMGDVKIDEDANLVEFYHDNYDEFMISSQAMLKQEAIRIYNRDDMKVGGFSKSMKKQEEEYGKMIGNFANMAVAGSLIMEDDELSCKLKEKSPELHKQIEKDNNNFNVPEFLVTSRMYFGFMRDGTISKTVGELQGYNQRYNELLRSIKVSDFEPEKQRTDKNSFIECPAVWGGVDDGRFN